MAHYSLKVQQLNCYGMMDLLKISMALLGGYAVFMGFIVVLVKTFFPLFTKEELERQKHQTQTL